MLLLRSLLVISAAYFLYLFIWLIGLGSLAWLKTHAHQQDLTVRRTHELFLLMPALNEHAIIQASVTSELAQLHLLPATIKPHLVVIDDASDDGTGACLAQLQDTMLTVIHRHRPQARLGKGAALNQAFRMIQTKFAPAPQSIYGVLDADAFMSAQDLQLVVHNFEMRSVDLIQTSVGMSNAKANWLTRAQNFEFFANNALIQTIRNLTHTAISSGNGQFMTQTYLDHVTWGNSLLEDCEFTIRGFLLGYRTYFLRQAVVYQQAIDKVRPLLTQRTRWCQGSLQCLQRYFTPIIKSKNIRNLQKIDLLMMLCVPIMGVVLIVSNLSAFLVQIGLTFSDHYYLVLLILGLCVLIFWSYMMWIYNQTAHKKHSELSLVAFVSFNLILAVVPFRSIFRTVLRREDWVKTTHKVYAKIN